MTATCIPRHEHLPFSVFSIPALLARPDLLPDRPGIYAALFPDGVELLSRWGYFGFDSRMPSTIDGHPILYAGMTKKLGIAHRIDNHVRGDSRLSSLRMSLGSLLRKGLGLRATTAPRKTYYHFSEGEERLSAWMASNILFAVHLCDDPGPLEKAMIQDGVFPLNITDRRAHPFSRHLMSKRRGVVATAHSVPGWRPPVGRDDRDTPRAMIA